MDRSELKGANIFVIHDFLNADECAALIARSEGMSFEKGTVGGEVFEDVRNNDRVLFDDEQLAAQLFERARPSLPASLEDEVLVGFNERWRFYRYDPGQTFKPHRDGSYFRIEARQHSRLTFMIYLNEGATGGRTNFFLDLQHAFHRTPTLTVEPKRGMALVFVHDILHEGAPVISGRKYVLRTDVMYGRQSRTEPADSLRPRQRRGEH
jgi:hypothetical protein